MRKTPSDTLIRATCDTCGDVELRVSDVQVLLCATTNEGSYTFRCTSCRFAVAKPADARVVDVLIAAGVELVVWDMPAELDEIHDGPPISYDDLMEFHFVLESGTVDLPGGPATSDPAIARAAHPANGRRWGRARH
ncbi:MAG: hypothetical protein ACRD1K_02450 [Acidimicrobiales bacterium]